MLGAFAISGIEKRADGRPKAYVVRDTEYLESDAAFVKRVLGGRKGRSSAIARTDGRAPKEPSGHGVIGASVE